MDKKLEVKNLQISFRTQGGILKAVRKISFDLYQGEHVSAGYKSVAFRIKMQDSNATLTDEAIDTQIAQVKAVLKKSIPELSFRE